MSFWNKIVTFLIGEPTGERARDSKGRYKADDKTTKNINEAYKDGRTPKKRGRPKGSKNKKAK
tara:strand:- start:1067 stop:1255 length:189 start_codon:yes stop_codon:yes gene_type:complete